MDTTLRGLVRTWDASPGDTEIAKQLDAAAIRAGAFTIKMAQSIRMLGNTLASCVIPPAHRIDISKEIIEWCKGVKPGYTSKVTDYAPAGFEFEAAHQVAAMFALEGTSHTYPDSYPDYLEQSKAKLYVAVMQFAKCGCSANGKRGCGQVAMGCLETHFCGGCNRCKGCRKYGKPFHTSHCVCGEYYQSVVGSDGVGMVGFDVHRLPHLCGCRGSGWQSTDADSIHRCPAHPVKSHHPECGNYKADLAECCAG